MSMSTSTEVIAHHWAFAIFLIVAIGLCCLMLVGGWFLGGRARARSKNVPFESGIDSVGSARLRLSAKFYLVAMFFVIFDVEALYLFAWSTSIRESGWVGFVPRHPTALTTHEMLYRWLCTKGYEVIVEQQIAHELQLKNVKTGTLAEIGQQADLAVVVGGDGNMLGAARTLARYDIKVIGINRGNLGFLTDLDPDNAQQQLADVLEGHYISEKRFLLEAQVCQQDCQKRISTAINEVVLHPGKVAHMIEFEVYIDEIFAFSQRSDGLIISTPTGSTAYSLSAGGPILTPSLDAITLVPMFPHTLSARPLVINSSSTIRLRFSHRRNDLEISCDSQIALPIQEGEDVLIRRCDYHLNLIHPKDYSYFNTLSTKLGWSKKLF